MALAAVKTCMPPGDHTLPPGRRKSSRSHGCTGWPPSRIHFLAAATSFLGGTTSSISFIDRASPTFTVVPLSSICSASPGGIRRATRWVPPAPGKSPTLTSGRPSLVFGLSAATLWWQDSASSNAPPTAVPLSAATNGLPQVSSRR